MRFFLVWLGIALAAAGCGQRGPLYYRDNPPPGVKPPKVETYTPPSYPKDADAERGGADEKK